jgi:hypothetical protein
MIAVVSFCYIFLLVTTAGDSSGPEKCSSVYIAPQTGTDGKTLFSIATGQGTCMRCKSTCVFLRAGPLLHLPESSWSTGGMHTVGAQCWLRVPLQMRTQRVIEMLQGPVGFLAFPSSLT